jgi:hypothetical protein
VASARRTPGIATVLKPAPSGMRLQVLELQDLEETAFATRRPQAGGLLVLQVCHSATRFFPGQITVTVVSNMTGFAAATMRMPDRLGRVLG